MLARIVLKYIGLLSFAVIVQCKTLLYQKSIQALKNVDDSYKAGSKQLFFTAQGKESSTSDFVRLVVMRLIYGIASTMGLEERLEEVFKGAFVPPSAQDDIFGFGGTNDGDTVNLSDMFDTIEI